MDSLTHVLVGHAMGAAAASVAQPYGAAVYWAALVGNSLPDIDVPISLLLGRGIKLHRTFTHTIPGAVLLSAAAAVVLHALFPMAPFALLFGWTFLGTLSHMGMDCLNLFGARPFWPLSGRSIDLGVLHIMDPILMALLGLPTLGTMVHVTSVRLLSASFLLIWPYVLYRLARARDLYYRLKANGAERARVVPWYSSWRYIRETAGEIEFGLWNRGRLKALATYVKLDSPAIRASMADPAVADFLAKAEYPYALVEEDEQGHSVVWGDVLRQQRADFRPLRVRVEG